MKYTKKKHEQYLNDLYNEEFTFDENMENFLYLTSEDRRFTIKLGTLEKAIHRGMLGTLLRSHDPIAFEYSYNDEKRERFDNSYKRKVI